MSKEYLHRIKKININLFQPNCNVYPNILIIYSKSTLKARNDMVIPVNFFEINQEQVAELCRTFNTTKKNSKYSIEKAVNAFSPSKYY